MPDLSLFSMSTSLNRIVLRTPDSLIFGKLTTSFTNYAIAQNVAFSSPGADSQKILDDASEELKRVSAKDASYLVYIGELPSSPADLMAEADRHATAPPERSRNVCSYLLHDDYLAMDW